VAPSLISRGGGGVPCTASGQRRRRRVPSPTATCTCTCTWTHLWERAQPRRRHLCRLGVQGAGRRLLTRRARDASGTATQSTRGKDSPAPPHGHRRHRYQHRRQGCAGSFALPVRPKHPPASRAPSAAPRHRHPASTPAPGRGAARPPPIDAPCTRRLRHGDPIHARKGLTPTARSPVAPQCSPTEPSSGAAPTTSADSPPPTTSSLASLPDRIIPPGHGPPSQATLPQLLGRGTA
jgi:hypothetical protein